MPRDVFEDIAEFTGKSRQEILENRQPPLVAPPVPVPAQPTIPTSQHGDLQGERKRKLIGDIQQFGEVYPASPPPRIGPPQESQLGGQIIGELGRGVAAALWPLDAPIQAAQGLGTFLTGKPPLMQAPGQAVRELAGTQPATTVIQRATELAPMVLAPLPVPGALARGIARPAVETLTAAAAGETARHLVPESRPVAREVAGFAGEITAFITISLLEAFAGRTLSPAVRGRLAAIMERELPPGATAEAAKAKAKEVIDRDLPGVEKELGGDIPPPVSKPGMVITPKATGPEGALPAPVPSPRPGLVLTPKPRPTPLPTPLPEVPPEPIPRPAATPLPEVPPAEGARPIVTPLPEPAAPKPVLTPPPERPRAEPPIAPEVRNPKLETAPAGRAVEMFSPDDPAVKFEARYRAVELDDLITNDPAVQPRNRTLSSSRQQIEEMRKTLSADRYLAGETELNIGPAIVGADLKVEARNGGITAIREARDFPAGSPERAKYEQFQADIRARAAEFGIPPEQLAGMRDPIIVRERLTPVADRKAFGDLANKDPSLAARPAELAMRDARMLDPKILDRLEVAEGQQLDVALNHEANRQIRSEFLGAMPTKDRGALVNPKTGELSPEGVRRLKNAVLAVVFPDDTRLLEAMAEGAKTEGMATVETGIFKSLGKLARMKSLIAQGARPKTLDITEDIPEVLDVLAFLKRQGMTVDDFRRQEDFTKPKLSTAQELLLRRLHGAKTQKSVSELFGGYADRVIRMGEPEDLGGLPGLGPAAQKPRQFKAKEEVIQARRIGTVPTKEAMLRELEIPGPGGVKPEGRLERFLRGRKPEPVEPAVEGDVPPPITGPSEPGKPATVAAPTLVTRQKIIERVHSALLPIRHGKLWDYPKRVAGIFKPKAGVARLRNAADVGTMFHEVAHWMQKIRKGFTHEDLAAFNDELHPIASPGGDPTFEGFAEFGRLYVTDHTRAAQVAPRFFAYYERELAKFPEINDIIQASLRDWQRFQRTPDEYKILGMIVRPKEMPEFADFDDFLYATVNEYHPLKVMNDDLWKALTADKKLLTKYYEEMGMSEAAARAAAESAKPEQNFLTSAEHLAALTKGNVGRAIAMIERGVPKFGNPQTIVAPGLREVFKPFESSRRMQDAELYLIAQRAIEREKKGKRTGIDLAWAENTVRKLDSEEMRKMADGVYKFNDALVDFVADAGVIPRAQAERIKAASKNFVPFHRALGVKRGLFRHRVRGFTNIGEPIKRFRGSELPILSPVDTMIRNALGLTELAYRNQVMGAAVRMVESAGRAGGRWMERVTWPKQPLKTNRESLIKFLERQGLNKELAAEVADELPEEVIVAMREARTLPNTEMWATYRRNGVAEPWVIADKNLHEVLTAGLSPEEISFVMQAFAKPAAGVRAGAILTIEFPFPNIFRDQFGALMFTKHNYKPFYDWYRGIQHYYKDDKVWDLYQRSGAMQATMHALDRDYLGKAASRLVDKDFGLRKITTPIDGLRALSEFSEHGTRLGEFARALTTFGRKRLGEKGRKATLEEILKSKVLTEEDIMRAGYAAREVSLNFQRHGAKTAFLRHSVPFWNPGVQAVDKIAREMRENPSRMGLTLASIGAMSTWLWFSQHDDPRYRNAPQGLKDRNWIWFPGHISQEQWDGMSDEQKMAQWLTGYRFPKPHDPGIVIGTGIERFLDWAIDNHPDAISEWAEAIWKDFSANPMHLAWNVALWKPLLENWSNWSRFRDRRLVPRGLEDNSPEFQAQAYTSEFGRAMGQLTGFSPIHIDNLVVGYGAGLGSLALEMSNLGKTASGHFYQEGVVPPSPGLADVPVLRRFITRMPTSQAESINDFWRYYDKVSRARKDLGLAEREQNPAMLERIMTKHASVLPYMDMMEQTAQELREINSEIATIRKKPNFSEKYPEGLTGPQKRRQIDLLTIMAMDRAGWMIRQIREMENPTITLDATSKSLLEEMEESRRRRERK